MMNQNQSDSLSTTPEAPEPLFEDDDPVGFKIDINDEIATIIDQRETVYTDTGFPDD